MFDPTCFRLRGIASCTVARRAANHFGVVRTSACILRSVTHSVRQHRVTVKNENDSRRFECPTCVLWISASNDPSQYKLLGACTSSWEPVPAALSSFDKVAESKEEREAPFSSPPD